MQHSKLNEIIKTNEYYFQYDLQQLEMDAEELSSYMNNKLFFNQNPYQPHEDETISYSIRNKNIRQSYFKKCIFQEADLTRAGLAGSIFLDCVLNVGEYNDTNFQSCDFRSTKFKNASFKFTRFNKSTFYNCEFINCEFKSASFNDVIFNSCKFQNCKWTIAIENAIFRNTLLDNVQIRRMNFEYATFDNIKIVNTKMPFPTIPFIFNGLKYLMNTMDNVTLTSAKCKEGMSKDEYLKLLPVLESFYLNSKDYFPLANILLAKKENEKALTAIIFGIQLAIDLRSFRMIKNYCKLLDYFEVVTAHQKQEVYNLILRKIEQSNLDSYEQSAFNLYVPEIRDKLLNSQNNKRVEISFSTNIESNESDKISTILNAFELIFSKNKIPYVAELRHNSPESFNFILDIIDVAIPLVTSTISFIVMQIQRKKDLKAQKKSSEKMDQLIELQKKILQSLDKPTQASYNKVIDKIVDSNINIYNLTINNNGKIETENTDTI